MRARSQAALSVASCFRTSRICTRVTCSRPTRRACRSASCPPEGPRGSADWARSCNPAAAGGRRGRMSTPRMRRVDEAIRQVLGDALAADLKDPRVGFVTVTDVRTSVDLRHARVYVSVLGADGGASLPEERETTLEGLRSAHGYLQGRLASELRLKRTPRL